MRHFLLQSRRVPLLGIGAFGDVTGDHILDHLLAHVGDDLVDLALRA